MDHISAVQKSVHFYVKDVRLELDKNTFPTILDQTSVGTSLLLLALTNMVKNNIT